MFYITYKNITEKLIAIKMSPIFQKSYTEKFGLLPVGDRICIPVILT